MTDLSAEQSAILERLCRKHRLLIWDNDEKDYVDIPDPDAIAALRELLLAVQETNAEAVRMNECGKDDDGHSCHEDDARAIRAQTYSDLFPSTPKEE